MLLDISTSIVASSKTINKINVQTDQNTYRVGHTTAHGNVVVYCFIFWGEGGSHRAPPMAFPWIPRMATAVQKEREREGGRERGGRNGGGRERGVRA